MWELRQTSGARLETHVDPPEGSRETSAIRLPMVTPKWMPDRFPGALPVLVFQPLAAAVASSSPASSR